MRDFRRIATVVLVVGISVFLIYRSCHDKHGIDDPNRGGGIGGVTAMVQEQRARPEITTPTTTATPAPTATPRGAMVRQQTSRSAEEVIGRYEPRYQEFNSVESDSVAPTRQRSSAMPRAARRETEKIQGTWILIGPNNTILELTVRNNDEGSLKSYRSETEKNDSVERKVRVVAEGNSIWVVASDADASISRLVGSETIMLAFSFGTSGAPTVVKLNPRDKEPAQLRVVSHTR